MQLLKNNENESDYSTDEEMNIDHNEDTLRKEKKYSMWVWFVIEPLAHYYT